MGLLTGGGCPAHRTSLGEGIGEQWGGEGVPTEGKTVGLVVEMEGVREAKRVGDEREEGTGLRTGKAGEEDVRK